MPECRLRQGAKTTLNGLFWVSGSGYVQEIDEGRENGFWLAKLF